MHKHCSGNGQKKCLFSLILAMLFLQNSKAQSTFVGGLFPTIDHAARISKHLEYGLYYFGAFPMLNFNKPSLKKDATFLLFYSEQSLTYHVSKNLSFAGSYVYQRENVVKSNYSNEHRIHVQATYKHGKSDFQVKHRLRFDNRFIRNRTTGETPYTHRLRYLLGVDMPIKTKKNNLYFTAYEEAFFNTYHGAGFTYAENWAYAAIGIMLNQRNRIETGPLYIAWNTGGSDWFHQYYLQVSWVSRFDFVK